MGGTLKKKTSWKKQGFMYLVSICLAFTFIYAVPKQKAHAILPLVIAGQFVKKAASKALAGVLVRQGAKAGSKETIKKATMMIGSRMTPAQHTSFQAALQGATYSLDNKWMKIIIGAELAGVLAGLTGDMHDAATETPGELIPYNAELVDNDGLTIQEVFALDLEGATTAETSKKFMVFPTMVFPGMEVVGKEEVSSWYPGVATAFGPFDSDNPAVLDTDYGHLGMFRSWSVGYINNDPTPAYPIGLTGINVYQQTSSSVKINFYLQQTSTAPGFWHPLPESSYNPGHFTVATLSVTNEQWNDYYTNYLSVDPYIYTHGLINDFLFDGAMVVANPMTQDETGGYEFQVPNPDYWDLPGMEEAYYDQLQQFPDATTVIDPNNYDDGGGIIPPTEPLDPPSGAEDDPIVTQPKNPWRDFFPSAMLLALLDLLRAILMYLARMFQFIVLIPTVTEQPIDNAAFVWWKESTWLGIKPYYLTISLATFFASFAAFKSIRRLLP